MSGHTVYKILWRDQEGRLLSMRAADLYKAPQHALQGAYRLEYVPGQVVHPTVPGSRLYVFRHLEEAQEYARNALLQSRRRDVTFEFWECTGFGALKRYPLLSIALLNTVNNWEEAMRPFRDGLCYLLYDTVEALRPDRRAA